MINFLAPVLCLFILTYLFVCLSSFLSFFLSFSYPLSLLSLYIRIIKTRTYMAILFRALAEIYTLTHTHTGTHIHFICVRDVMWLFFSASGSMFSPLRAVVSGQSATLLNLTTADLIGSGRVAF